VEAAIRVVRKFQNSTFTQDITLVAGVPRVDIRTQADWREKHILLKAAFPLNVQSEKATYEIPYGSIERPTTRRNSIEKAQFEVPALRWADLSDGKHGFSLLNDCKYGYDGKANVLRVSLLRAPTYPDPHADEGRHEFTYSLYPHSGDWKQARTIRRGYELNYKLLSLPVEGHAGKLGKQHSYLEVEPENVIVTAWKKSEDGNDLIIRFYEWQGQEKDVKLTVQGGLNSAAEVNLMEEMPQTISVHDDAVTVHTKPYEIKTVKVQANLRRN
jgi:alpha-mannosidase